MFSFIKRNVVSISEREVAVCGAIAMVRRSGELIEVP